MLALEASVSQRTVASIIAHHDSMRRTFENMCAQRAAPPGVQHGI